MKGMNEGGIVKRRDRGQNVKINEKWYARRERFTHDLKIAK